MPPYSLFSGFLLDKKIGVNQPKRIENAKILVANTSMDADKIKASMNKIPLLYLGLVSCIFSMIVKLT